MVFCGLPLSIASCAILSITLKNSSLLISNCSRVGVSSSFTSDSTAFRNFSAASDRNQRHLQHRYRGQGTKSVICSRKRKVKGTLSEAWHWKVRVLHGTVLDRTAHSVDNGNRCIVKCDSCLRAATDICTRASSFFPSLYNWKIFKDPLYCRYCKSIRKCLCFSGCISFHTVTKCIKACCCCDLWRCSHSKLRVDNGKIRHENFAFKKHLDVFLVSVMIVNCVASDPVPAVVGIAAIGGIFTSITFPM